MNLSLICLRREEDRQGGLDRRDAPNNPYWQRQPELTKKETMKDRVGEESLERRGTGTKPGRRGTKQGRKGRAIITSISH